MKFIDAHEDIALNALYATGKDIFKKHQLKQGQPPIVGLAPNNNSDIPRLKEGRVRLVFATIFSLDKDSATKLAMKKPENYNFKKIFGLKFGLAGALEQLSFYHYNFSRSRSLILIESKKDYQDLKKSRKIGFLLHLEGVDYFRGSIGMLDVFFDLGVRSLALTWRNNNPFASGNNSVGGLTPLGRKLIKMILKKGVILDLAHSNNQTFWDMINVIDFPVIVSHTLCRRLCNNSRNLDDDQIKAVAKTGGVICLAAIPDYIGGNKIKDYVNHFSHIANLVGVDHVAFGTDFDGLTDPVDRFIKDFEDVSMFPNVYKQLKRGGFTKGELEKISYKNLERIILNRFPSK